MPELLNFTDASPRFALPLLHSGQAHKEAFVNEALLLSDALMHCLVLGEAATPPENSLENDAWIVASGATREWSGQDGAVALRRGGGWAFVAPRDGLRVFDASRGAEMLFFGFWRKGSLPVEPLGGTSVDGEARTAINDLIAALQALGILPSV
ncbi:DUF2793 domain-containing protein [Novosphingobium resinovorum]|uniref:DUF2793 domain-containing protein n=1 Tax=Novosphingobium resinovorum TaxID=158500 RepID=A0A031JN28_9SPHN|nr:MULTISPECIES: DUF2793 domain-containing protein [Sphingomonadaceae]AOR78000.1 hypothetical protein BES08_15505 [Novosphingobium resinovorum]EJU13610.1 hypothetical protein LH128_07944 [Sphingomonas sp. LH128]EZP74642.1 hypothetical protein BV97_04838 [Novosphingobium resinovorum]MBF7010101.1 DUF2793 domain-containing protein [Novosphingobium sp. HR1a]WJM28121.1 DUF2793 domain-containing protein [Novosphingobium resinovorum]